MGNISDTVKRLGEAGVVAGTPAAEPSIRTEPAACAESEHGAGEPLGVHATREAAARERADRKAAQEERLREAIAEREKEEARLERLARERLEAEHKEQAALAARIEAERRLAAQMEARLAREREADELAKQNAARKAQLRQAAAERKAQERRLQAERLAARNAARAVAASASPVAAIYAKYLRFPLRYYLAAALVAAAGVYAAGHFVHRAAMPGDAGHPGIGTDAVSDAAADAEGLPLRLSPVLGDAGSAAGAARPASAAEEQAAKAEKEWAFRSGAVREQLKAGAYADVARSAQALTYDFPDHWESWFWLGTAQLALGRNAAGEESLERAGKLNPGEAQVWVQRAIAAQERSDHAAAIRLLTEARALSPDSPQVYLHLGYSNDALGQFAEAEKNYRTFLSLTEGDSAYAAQRQPVIERLGNGRR